MPAPALARTHHPPRHAAKPHHAVKTLEAPPADPAVPPYALAGQDAPGAAAAIDDSPPPGVAGELADWIAASDDNGKLPFMIVDKLGARIYAFDAGGRLLGSAPILVGLARGDTSPPEIRGLKLAQISADQRTTPAGRFVTQWGASDGHGTMLWVDLADAISMHPVMSVNADEHRNQRIKSSDPDDHRISYGCINLPKTFYDSVVLTALNGGDAVVYVMPDTKPISEVFPAFAAASAAPSIAGEDHHPSHQVDTAAIADAPGHNSDRQPPPLDPVSDRWTQPPM
jgi:hypothetical protein